MANLLKILTEVLGSVTDGAVVRGRCGGQALVRIVPTVCVDEEAESQAGHDAQQEAPVKRHDVEHLQLVHKEENQVEQRGHDLAVLAHRVGEPSATEGMVKVVIECK